MLPIINLNPSDDNCIYSTLLFIQNQAKTLNIETPAVTFDQSLWIKAIEVCHCKEYEYCCSIGGISYANEFCVEHRIPYGWIWFVQTDGNYLCQKHSATCHSKGITCPFHRRLCTYNSSYVMLCYNLPPLVRFWVNILYCWSLS